MKTLVLGDLHLGSGRSLALAPELLEVLLPELSWADRLILNGDVLHTGPLEQVLSDCRVFFDFAGRHINEFTVVLGNHEMWLPETSRRLSLIDRRDVPFPDLILADYLFSSFLPEAIVEVAYPSLSLPGAEVVHGHQLLIRANYPGPLTPLDYHELLSPWCETFWAFSESKEGPPEKLSEGLKARPRLAPRGELLPLSAVAPIAAELCQDHALNPGSVILGHLHQQFGPLRAGEFEFWSGGCWYLDPYIREFDDDPLSAHPGGVIRLSGGALEHRRLLDGFSFSELERLAG